MADASSFLKVVAMGPLELDLTLAMTEEEMKKFGVTNISEINSLVDCKSFINSRNIELSYGKAKKDPSILDHIRLTSNNSTINTLLFINKAFKKKTFIEYLTFSEPVYTEEESFMKEVVKYVTEQNYMFIIENGVFDSPVKIKFTIKLADSKDSNCARSFDLNLTNQPINIPEDKHLYEILNYDFDLCNYFIVDLNHVIELNKTGCDFTAFGEFVKILTERNKKMNIVMSFPDIIFNVSSLNLDSITAISELVSYTDIFIFEKKEAIALFNLLHQLNSDSEGVTEEKKNLELLFLKEVEKKRKQFPKIGIFFDEFNRLTVIEQQAKSNLILFHSDFEFDLISPNISKVLKDDCKKLLAVYYNYLKFVFVGGFLSRLFHKRSFATCFTAGSESVKRIVEIIRLGLDYPNDNNFFNVKIKKVDNKEKREEIEKKKKEKHFVLDCANHQTSKMRSYNPLLDGNLQSFFSSEPIRHHLKKLGFINRKGQILQDPDTKRLGIIKNRKLVKGLEQEQNKLLMIKENNEKMKLEIKNVLIGSAMNLSNINQNELEKLPQLHNFVSIAGKSLPGEFQVAHNDKSKNKSVSPLRNDLYAKAIAENKKDYFMLSRKENKKVKKEKPVPKETYLKIMESNNDAKITHPEDMQKINPSVVEKENSVAKLQKEESKTQNEEAKLQKAESKTQNEEAKLQKAESKVLSEEAKLQSAKSKVLSEEAKLQSAKSKVPSEEAKLQSAKSKVPSEEAKLQSAKSKVPSEDPKLQKVESKVLSEEQK